MQSKPGFCTAVKSIFPKLKWPNRFAQHNLHIKIMQSTKFYNFWNILTIFSDFSKMDTFRHNQWHYFIIICGSSLKNPKKYLKCSKNCKIWYSTIFQYVECVGSIRFGIWNSVCAILKTAVQKHGLHRGAPYNYSTYIYIYILEAYPRIAAGKFQFLFKLTI